MSELPESPTIEPRTLAPEKRRRKIVFSLLLVCVIVSLLTTLFAVRERHSAPELSQHISDAQLWSSPSTQWNPPTSLERTDDNPLAAENHWADVTLPHARARNVASAQPIAPHTPQVVWYRAPVKAAALTSSPQGTRVYVPRWQTIGTVAVYLDNELVWQTRGSRVWNSFNRPVWVDLGTFAHTPSERMLYVRMASEPGVGGALSSIWVGPANELRDSWRLRTLFETGLISISLGSYLVLGIFALFFWMMRSVRGEVVYLLFFLMAISHVFAGLHFLVDEEGITLPDDWFSWLTQVGFLGTSVCSFFFLCVVQRQRRPRLAGILVVYALAIIVATIPTWGLHHSGILPLMRMALLPPEVLVLVVAWRGAVRLRNASSILIAVWIVLSLPLGIYDIALQSYRVSIEGVYLTPYVYLGLFTLFMMVAFTRYTGALDASENANLHMADRLRAQESELEQTHHLLIIAEREQTLLQERQRLMREMHDGVGSSLMTALRLVERGDASKLNLPQMLKECIDDLKISIDSLEPVDHDLLALLASLRYRLEPRLEGAGLRLNWTDVRDVPALPWLDAQSALHILRILQEVLTNIIKHNSARNIYLRTLEATRNGKAGIQVEVLDDGESFVPPASPPPGRKGLANVRVRAAVLTALVAWEPLLDGGNRFSLWLPIVRA